MNRQVLSASEARRICIAVVKETRRDGKDTILKYSSQNVGYHVSSQIFIWRSLIYNFKEARGIKNGMTGLPKSSMIYVV